MTPNCSPEELEAGCQRICKAYLEAPENWSQKGIKTLSTDEKTGIQALERAVEDLPMRQGDTRKQEYEYIRHGTQCLTANWDVLNGGIANYTLGATRTEKDFCDHIKTTVKTFEKVKQFCFITDNLNTHQSESLVKLVAKEMKKKDKQDIELGEKGKFGILKNMASRALFLSDQTHPIYFVYTPKHCSWLNQIELWFGALTRKLLKRGNFKSIQDLNEQIDKFITYFNETMAKPCKWTFNGQPLKL
jgi:transposase